MKNGCANDRSDFRGRRRLRIHIQIELHALPDALIRNRSAAPISGRGNERPKLHCPRLSTLMGNSQKLVKTRSLCIYPRIDRCVTTYYYTPVSIARSTVRVRSFLLASSARIKTCGEGICPLAYLVKKKRERKGIIRGRQIAVTALQNVSLPRTWWDSGVVGAMTRTDRTNRISSDESSFFNSATFSAFANRNSWIGSSPSPATRFDPELCEILKFRGVHRLVGAHRDASREISRPLLLVGIIG